MVRTAVTLEVWNAINGTYHDLEKFREKRYSSRDLPGIIDFVKSRVNLIRGTIQNTQLIDDYSFTALNMKHFGSVNINQWVIPKCKRYTKGAHPDKYTISVCVQILWKSANIHKFIVFDERIH